MSRVVGEWFLAAVALVGIVGIVGNLVAPALRFRLRRYGVVDARRARAAEDAAWSVRAAEAELAMSLRWRRYADTNALARQEIGA